MQNIHASCVVINGQGILLIGNSGSGKSDLTLRLINDGATLVSDDRTEIEKINGKVFARSPENIKGLLEVRGIGVLKVPFAEKTEIKLVVNLIPKEKLERMPKEKKWCFDEIEITEFEIYPFEISSIIKIKTYLKIANNEILIL